MRRQPVQVGCHKTEFFLKVRFHQPIESVFLFICVEVYLCFKNGENGQDIKEYAYRHVHHGLIATCVGMSALSVGTPLYCVGRARLNWMVDDYNSRLSRGELNVSLGPQRHGIGLSINF